MQLEYNADKVHYIIVYNADNLIQLFYITRIRWISVIVSYACLLLWDYLVMEPVSVVRE